MSTLHPHTPFHVLSYPHTLIPHSMYYHTHTPSYPIPCTIIPTHAHTPFHILSYPHTLIPHSMYYHTHTPSYPIPCTIIPTHPHTPYVGLVHARTKLSWLFLLTGCLKALLQHTPAWCSRFQDQDNFPVIASM